MERALFFIGVLIGYYGDTYNEEDGLTINEDI